MHILGQPECGWGLECMPADSPLLAGWKKVGYLTTTTCVVPNIQFEETDEGIKGLPRISFPLNNGGTGDYP